MKAKYQLIFLILFLISACNYLNQNETLPITEIATDILVTNIPTQTLPPIPTMTPTATQKAYSLDSFNSQYISNSFSINSDGKTVTVLSESEDDRWSVFLWNIAAPDKPIVNFKSPLLMPTAATFNLDGSLFTMSGCEEDDLENVIYRCNRSRILLFDWNEREIIREFIVEDEFGLIIVNLSFSPSGKELIFQEAGGYFSVLDLETETVAKRIFRSYKMASTNGSSVSPTESIIAIATHFGTELWNIETREQITVLEGPFTSSYFPGVVAFNSQGNKLASNGCTDTGFEACGEEAITIYDVDSQKEIKTISSISSSVTSIEFSPNDSILAFGTWKEGLYLWNLKTNQRIQVEEFQDIAILDIEFTPDGKTLIIGSNTGLHLFDLSDITF